MPQVPYQPWAESPAQNIPTPGVHVQTPEGAFGVDTAKALERLGSQIGQTGDMVYKNAMEFQDLQNQTTAREADMKRMTESSKEREDFKALPIEQKAAALEGHNQRLQEISKKYREGLNPMASKYYDAYGHADLRHQMFSAAGEAGDATRAAAQQSSEARLGMILHGLEQNPDQDNFDRAKKQIELEVAQSPKLTSEMAELKTKELISKALVARIKGLSRTDDIGARNMMDQYGDQILEPDYGTLDGFLTDKSRDVRIDKLVKDIVYPQNEDPNKPRISLEAAVKEARSRATNEMPNDNKAPMRAEQAVRSTWQRRTQEIRVNEVLNEGVVSDEIYTNRPTTVEGFLSGASEKARDAWDNLTPAQKEKMRTRINNIWRHGADDRSPDRDDWRRYLLGLTPQKLLDEDLDRADLTTKDREHFVKEQRKAAQNPQLTDTRVDRAMSYLRGRLDRPDVRLNKDQKTYFRGALKELIFDYMEKNNGKQPGEKELDSFGDIFLKEMRDNTVSWYNPFSGWAKKRLFMHNLPTDKDEIEALKKDEAAGLIRPGATEEDKREYYISKKARRIFNETFNQELLAPVGGRMKQQTIPRPPYRKGSENE